ncbi:MAG: T9SS type A sorting domain-containing protein [Bacteroidales bacterium]|nr:T9SS type A sorting domain-containing protein [Bacteroidales bacterium]
MRKFYFLMIGLLLINFSSYSQIHVEQVLVGNGGIYGNDADHVSITSINPTNLNSSFVGEVIRESIQDMIIVGNYAYVAAEDSIAKFDIINHIKVAVIYESNLSRLYFANNQLFVSRRSDLNGAPADGIYLKTFDAELNLLNSANGISTDAAGILMIGDSIYVAVSGDWQATEGKMAVISADFSYIREINLGTDAVGIIDLFEDGETIYTVNKSPWGATTGSISTYQINTASWTTNIISNVVGKGVKRVNDILYLGLDYGIGSYDLTNAVVINNQIVPDPGSANYIAVAAAAFDEINERFYVSITDYFSFGEGKVYDLDGTQTGSFEVGVSAEAMAIHYVDETLLNELNEINVNVYPNPTHGLVYIQSEENIRTISVYNEMGQIVLIIQEGNSKDVIDLSELKVGFYFVKIESDHSFAVKKILKR